MCGDGKESYRVPSVMYSDDLISYITSVCNGCLAYSKCEIAKTFSVLDRCENDTVQTKTNTSYRVQSLR